jgi:hypothetical protein
MEFPWPKWMELVTAGVVTGVCIVALVIISRIQEPKKKAD